MKDSTEMNAKEWQEARTGGKLITYLNKTMREVGDAVGRNDFDQAERLSRYMMQRVAKAGLVTSSGELVGASRVMIAQQAVMAATHVHSWPFQARTRKEAHVGWDLVSSLRAEVVDLDGQLHEAKAERTEVQLALDEANESLSEIAKAIGCHPSDVSAERVEAKWAEGRSDGATESEALRVELDDWRSTANDANEQIHRLNRECNRLRLRAQSALDLLSMIPCEACTDPGCFGGCEG